MCDKCKKEIHGRFLASDSGELLCDDCSKIEPRITHQRLIDIISYFHKNDSFNKQEHDMIDDLIETSGDYLESFTSDKDKEIKELQKYSEILSETLEIWKGDYYRMYAKYLEKESKLEQSELNNRILKDKLEKCINVE